MAVLSNWNLEFSKDDTLVLSWPDDFAVTIRTKDILWQIIFLEDTNHRMHAIRADNLDILLHHDFIFNIPKRGNGVIF